MITINYCKNGIPMSDFEARQYVSNIIKEFHEFKTTFNIETSSENVVNSFRLAIVEDKISINEIIFKYENNVLQLTEYGTFETFPKGFIDINTSIARYIVKAQSIKRRKNV